MEITESLVKRFWMRVQKLDQEQCWEWQGALRAGYGCMRYGRKVINCHRLSFVIHHGPVPEGLIVGHKCDNRRCVNPHHLEAITYAQNNYDGAHRGRQRRGVKTPCGVQCFRAVLNDDLVREIRRLRSDFNLSSNQIAARLNTSRSAIKQVIAGVTWKHVV